jgi:hypothetical protein
MHCTGYYVKRSFFPHIRLSLYEYLLLLPLAPQPSLGLGLLHKTRLNFLEASQQFSFLLGRVVSPTPTPILEDQASVFISPRGREATHFSRLLRHAWITVGLIYRPTNMNAHCCQIIMTRDVAISSVTRIIVPGTRAQYTFICTWVVLPVIIHRYPRRWAI